MTAKFLSERLGQRDHACFRGPVRRVHCRRVDPVHRRQGHHRPAAALLDHLTADRLEQIEDLAEVVLDGPIPVTQRELLRLVPFSSANDVNADVYRTEVGCRLPDGALDLIRLGHVRDDWKGLAPSMFHLVDDRPGAAGIDVDARHRCARLGKPQRAQPPVPGPLGDVACTGDQCALSTQTEINHVAPALRSSRWRRRDDARRVSA